MKTLKALFKDLIGKTNPKTYPLPPKPYPHPLSPLGEPEGASSQPYSLGKQEGAQSINQKPKNYERETDEVLGHPGMDNSDARENPRISEEFQATAASGVTGSDSSNEEKPDTDRLIREAYEKGLIDGRNSKIEEVHFPTTDDGVPRFNGAAPSSLDYDSIFTLALEA